MKRFLQTVALIAAMMVPAVADASGLRGDLDGDGRVNINDVTTLINCLLTGNDVPAAADCDMDGNVNISDVAALINYLLSGSWPSTPSQEHEWVDLGLTSGTLWATCNIGASAPEDYGDYFAWGETEPKDYYGRETYKWYREDDYSPYYRGYTKYCTSSYYGYNGFTDGKTELDPEDDAATANWGIEARMPSPEQFEELYYSCTWQWTTRNGVNGLLGVGPNGNTIFLPATGFRNGGGLEYAEYGDYWSRSLDRSCDLAYELCFDSDSVYRYEGTCRDHGLPVRAVRAYEEHHEYVDLGLPSGTLWATRNIGASTPEDYGDYFAWGETTPKDYYDWSNYKWYRRDDDTPFYYGLTKYCTNPYDGYYDGYRYFTDGKTELDPEDDAAYVNWGPSWRMPSVEQIQELVNLCTWRWTTRYGVNGQLVVGPNGRTIFLPAAGDRYYGALEHVGKSGEYWSRTRTLDSYDSYYADNLYFSNYNDYGYWESALRECGYTVRAVRVP